MRHCSLVLFCLTFVLTTLSVAQAQTPQAIPVISPQSAGFDAARLRVIEELVQEGLSQSKMPGCVVVVGCRAGVVYQGAWGFRQTVPQQLPMELSTVFDLASLTKPIATATSVMLLIQQGKIQLEAPASTYWPEFAQQGKDRILIRHLLTHTAGLIADNSINDYAGTPEESMAKIAALKPVGAPGEQFIYSDVGFLVLGQIVQLVSGKSVHEFSQESIFQPLGMTETGYLPGPHLQARAAVTEQREDRWMQGEVHDPRLCSAGHRRPCGFVFDGWRSFALCGDDAESRTPGRRAGVAAGNVDPDDDGDRGAPWSPNSRLGRTHGLLIKPWRSDDVFSFWAWRFHGHGNLD